MNGRIAGRVEGEARTLVRQLEHRFGAIYPAVRSRVARARVDELDLWTERVLDARRLADVFADA